MNETLRRCPFCGASAAWLTGSGFMECGHCTATGTADGAEGWNRRPIEDALRAERDAAVARAEAAEAEAERLRGLLSAERDGYAAGVADGRKAGAGEERDLIVACLRDFEKNGLPGLLSGAAQHIEAGCHWPDPLTSVW